MNYHFQGFQCHKWHLVPYHWKVLLLEITSIVLLFNQISFPHLPTTADLHNLRNVFKKPQNFQLLFCAKFLTQAVAHHFVAHIGACWIMSFFMEECKKNDIDAWFGTHVGDDLQ